MKNLAKALPLLALLGVCLSMATPAAAYPYHYPMHIGVRCQADFQNNWDFYIDVYGTCNNFINQIRGTDYVDFYYNLHGAAAAFANGNGADTCNGCGGADSVDFLLVSTHGNVSGNYAYYDMWDEQTKAATNTMRLGDNGKQLKVLATYACRTFRTWDGLLWNRWANAFRGGLKLGLGSHDLVYDGDPQKGTEFASRMQDLEPIGQAWNEAVWYANDDNAPSAVATGANGNDCWYRMDHLNLVTVQYYYPWRDNLIGSWCARGWNGV